MGDEVEVGKNQVIGKYLQEICRGVNVNVPPNKHRKLLAVCNLLIRYLS